MRLQVSALLLLLHLASSLAIFDLCVLFKNCPNRGQEPKQPRVDDGPAAIKVDDDWVDPVIGARARFVFSEKWTGTGFIDYGGFRNGSETWQVLYEYALGLAIAANSAHSDKPARCFQRQKGFGFTHWDDAAIQQHCGDADRV